MKKILIVGAGAIGGSLAAYLGQTNSSITIYERQKGIADEINQGHTVVVNFEETNASEARYILAFLSGASYANHGEVRPIAAKTYIFTPAGVSLSGAEIRDDLAQNGVTF